MSPDHDSDGSDDLAPYRLALRSADPVEPRAQALADLYPEAVRDGRIDLDALAALLGDLPDEGPERFGLSWPGKAAAVRLAQRPSAGTLVPVKGDSVEWDSTKNIFIEGENLEVLKLLQRSYHGKVKLIYIDPPYNTGKDFVYPDNYRDPLGKYLRFSGQTTENGGRLRANAETSGRYHSSWLSMMWPRLHLARSLLRDDGVLAVSINDVELPHLRMILDEVFGEENRVCSFVWHNGGNVDNQSLIKGVHEHLLCYARIISGIPRPTVIDPNVSDDSKLFRDKIENSITKNGPKNRPSTVRLPVGFPTEDDSLNLSADEGSMPQRLDPIESEDGALVRDARLRSGWSSKRLLELFIANGFAPIADKEGIETSFVITATGAIYQLKQRPIDQGYVRTRSKG